MSKLLEQGIDAIRQLPDENQDFAGLAQFTRVAA